LLGLFHLLLGFLRVLADLGPMLRHLPLEIV
jgi:hypothetical protein